MAPSSSPVPPGYTRIWCPGFDTSGNEKDALVLYGWVIRGQLSDDVLRDAWWKLLHAWPILAARLRVDASSERKPGWYYLVPTHEKLAALRAAEEAKPKDDKTRIFSSIDRRPSEVAEAYRFTRGADLPRDRPSVARIDDNLSLWAPNSALSVKQLMDPKQDRSVVTVNLVTFRDATMVAFSTPHVLCDGVGGKEIVEAWSRCVRGQAAPAPLHHLGTDAFSELDRPESEPPAPPGWRAPGLWDLVRFGVRFAADVLYWRPPSSMENREVFLPKHVVASIKKQAMDGLRSAGGGDDDGRWVSTSDAVLAWILKRAHVDKAHDSRTMSVLYPSNLRWLPPGEGLKPLPLPYLQNGAFTIVLPEMPARDIVTTLSLGELAHVVRTSLQRQTTPAEIRKSLAWRYWSRGRTVIFFAPASHWFLVTNWRNMRLYDVDFGEAALVAAQGVGEAKEPPPRQQPQDKQQRRGDSDADGGGGGHDDDERGGKVLKVWGHGIHPLPMRNSFGLVADDPSGGIWLGGYLSRAEWERGFGDFMAEDDSRS